ncbi:hypothetical protein Q1695_014855 [Nippostrongylus brasiliensis]|nr:hypothetical protein Q1695_014855 [Nippostrongylus brasiliensis]
MITPYSGFNDEPSYAQRCEAIHSEDPIIRNLSINDVITAEATLIVRERRRCVLYHWEVNNIINYQLNIRKTPTDSSSGAAFYNRSVASERRSLNEAPRCYSTVHSRNVSNDRNPWILQNKKKMLA